MLSFGVGYAAELGESERIDDGWISGVEGLDIVPYSTLSPITPANTTGFVSVVLSVIGNYDPVVVEYRYQNSNGAYSYVREIQPDYPWLVSAGIFALVLFCVFRLWGAVFCKK